MACKNDTVNKIVKILDGKKAEDITVLGVSELTTLADYFIIATGKTERQTQALCDIVENELSKDGIFHLNKEGYHTGEWILIGYDDVIVHIFKPTTRAFYDLERIWQDGESIDVSDITD